MTGSTSILTPLRRRDFRLLWAGQTVSWIGNTFYEVAIMWLVLSLTHSTAAMAGVAAISALPQLVLSPIAGVVADRVNRRFLALSMDFGRGIVILSLPALQLVHHLALWQIYLVAFLLFTLFTFFLPARESMIPNLVPDDELPAANSLIQATVGMSMLLGFGLGGAVVAAIGVTPALFLDAASFVASVATLLAIHSSGSADRKTDIVRAAPLKEAAEGLAFILRQRALLTIFIFSGVIGLFVGPLLILPAPFSRNVLHAGAAGYGLLEASFMAGGIAGAVLGSTTARIRPVGWLLIAVVAIAGALLVGFSYMQLLVPAMLINVCIGSVTSLVEVPITTLIQRLTPDAVRGRVMSTMMMVNTAGIPLSVAAGGALAQVIGVAPLYRISGLAFVALALLSMFTPLSKLRSAPPSEDQPGEGGRAKGLLDPTSPSQDRAAG